jgi:hypothetical protein
MVVVNNAFIKNDEDLNDVQSQINEYDNIKIPKAYKDQASSRFYKLSQENNYDIALNDYNNFLTDVTDIRDKQAIIIDKIKNYATLDKNEKMAGKIALNEVDKKIEVFHRSKVSNVAEKEKLFHLIQKENLLLQQYYHDLEEKLITYDRKYEFGSGNVELLQLINKALFYFYLICLFVLCYYLYIHLAWDTKVKIFIVGLFVLYPFFIYRFEYFFWDNFVYTYCLLFSIPYKRPTKYSS